MGLLELFITAVALSMDAFAVAVCKGLSVRSLKPSHALSVGTYFGGFQALMPLVGFFLGSQFGRFITKFDHWIAFLLLGFIGLNMIKESKEEEKLDDSFSVKAMLTLAVATSIDALAVGVMFAIIKVNIVPAVIFIGVVTFSLSIVGIKVGNVFGAKFKSKAEIAGGVILICMGIKILIEHLFLS